MLFLENGKRNVARCDEKHNEIGDKSFVGVSNRISGLGDITYQIRTIA
jgi:hypothetical protein